MVADGESAATTVRRYATRTTYSVGCAWRADSETGMPPEPMNNAGYDREAEELGKLAQTRA